jgi:hypothetical protein
MTTRVKTYGRWPRRTATYDDANAVGFSAAGVVASNILSSGRGTLTLDGGVGFGTSEGEVAGRAGASFGW